MLLTDDEIREMAEMAEMCGSRRMELSLFVGSGRSWDISLMPITAAVKAAFHI